MNYNTVLYVFDIFHNVFLDVLSEAKNDKFVALQMTWTIIGQGRTYTVLLMVSKNLQRHDCLIWHSEYHYRQNIM